MATLNLYNMSGESKGTIEVSDSIFAVEVNKSVLHDVVVNYLANQRQGTQSALTRTEVRGGGIKPWRQKGTGRARQGSIRAPQWTGGGVVFAPKPRDYSYRLNKKVKKLAFKMALTTKTADIYVVEDLKFEEIKTANAVNLLKALGINPDIEVEVTERPYQKGDKFILCTDGFWGAMPEEEFIRHLSEKSPINKILESTANVVESIGRNSGSEYDNLTAAILEMSNNSILKEKMNKTAKIIIAVLSILLIGSIALNVSYFIGNDSEKDVVVEDNTEIIDTPKVEDTEENVVGEEQDSTKNEQN